MLGVKLVRIVGMEYRDTQAYFVANNPPDCLQPPADLGKLKSNALNFACQVLHAYKYLPDFILILLKKAMKIFRVNLLVQL